MTNYQLELEIKKLKSLVTTLKIRISNLERRPYSPNG